MKYTVIIENSGKSFGAYVPDLPGCVAVGTSEEEVIDLIKDAIEFHIEGLKSESKKIPKSKTKIFEFEVSV